MFTQLLYIYKVISIFKKEKNMYMYIYIQSYSIPK